MTLPINSLGYVRVAVVSPELLIADVAFNSTSITRALEQAACGGAQLAVFPELCLTGYTCADLFYQETLLREALSALRRVAAESARWGIATVVGLPLAIEGRIYNCAALLSGGTVCGIVPKIYLPTTREFYEQRWFTSGRHVCNRNIPIDGREIPFGTDLLFRARNLPVCVLGIEICEDLWAVQPHSGLLALAGATVIANPSASNELLGKVEYRRDLVRQQAARCLAGYLYAGAGPGESSTDTVFGGHSLIVENGSVLAETKRFQFDTQIAVADLDLQQLLNERTINSCFSQDSVPSSFRAVGFELPAPRQQPDVTARLLRNVPRLPFVPYDKAQRARYCNEIFAIQSTGLAKRLKHTAAQRTVIGISGGLDSTLALLVTMRAFELIGLARTGVVGVMMPGFGTTERTKSNAKRLLDLLGASSRCVPIGPAVRHHFQDIGHDETRHDVTYENAQARERTQILMDLANQLGGLVVGTGDLSELALGWCTFNGDHMSMYHVNAGVPKTLVRSLVEWCAEEFYTGEISAVLHDICATPITPELLPPDAKGEIRQKTEDVMGPFELHDFFLFYCVRHHFPSEKIVFLAQQAFRDEYTEKEIRRWLNVFYSRFFTQQFKRSAMPDGPKVGTVALSPRGDWRMPSDASPDVWLK